MDLMFLIFKAYPILASFQLIGLPQDAMFDRYTIEAKMDEETAAALAKLPQNQQWEIRRSMLRQVLADRFQLKVHKETREQPIYNLVIAKNGPKFKATPEGKEPRNNYGSGEISGDGLEIDQMLSMLSAMTRRILVNQTGLTGKYSFSLKWNPLDTQEIPDWAPPEFKTRPDLATALEEQLGLKLESAKGPVDVYIVDHVERPSAN